MTDIKELIKALNDAGVEVELGYHCIQYSAGNFRGTTKEQTAFLNGMAMLLRIQGGAAK